MKIIKDFFVLFLFSYVISSHAMDDELRIMQHAAEELTKVNLYLKNAKAELQNVFKLMERTRDDISSSQSSAAHKKKEKNQEPLQPQEVSQDPKVNDELFLEISSEFDKLLQSNDRKDLHAFLKSSKLPLSALLLLKNPRGETLLMVVSRKGTKEALKFILDCGAAKNINLQDSRGDSALFYAIQAKKADNVKLLIDYGADIYQKVRQQTSLSFAIIHNEIEIARIILNALIASSGNVNTVAIIERAIDLVNSVRSGDIVSSDTLKTFVAIKDDLVQAKDICMKKMLQAHISRLEQPSSDATKEKKQINADAHAGKSDKNADDEFADSKKKTKKREKCRQHNNDQGQKKDSLLSAALDPVIIQQREALKKAQDEEQKRIDARKEKEDKRKKEQREQKKRDKDARQKKLLKKLRSNNASSDDKQSKKQNVSNITQVTKEKSKSSSSDCRQSREKNKQATAAAKSKLTSGYAQQRAEIEALDEKIKAAKEKKAKQDERLRLEIELEKKKREQEEKTKKAFAFMHNFEWNSVRSHVCATNPTQAVRELHDQTIQELQHDVDWRPYPDSKYYDGDCRFGDLQRVINAQHEILGKDFSHS